LRDSLRTTTRIWIARRLIYFSGRVADLAVKLAPEINAEPFVKTTIIRKPGNDA
jgi:hypothetical protein